jgi:hypothetical protein|tara:strand:- start:1225 stop:1410 length:186 start_codon:yes stop_codon:yes gene_type:complete
MPITQSEFQFTYDDKGSPAENFNVWFVLNAQERSAWGDTMYSREEALEVFNNLFEKKVDNI